MPAQSLLIPDVPSCAELAPYLSRIDTVRWYTNFGPLSRELEQRIAQTFTSSSAAETRVVTLANATLALELALRALGLPHGARVLVPALTFVATAASIVRAGLVPVFCDVEADTWLMTAAMAHECVPRLGIAAVLPVSTYGAPQDIESWDAFSAETGVPVVIDAAGAFGNQDVSGRACMVFSMHATKTFAAGEGGLLVTCDERLAHAVQRASNFGIDPSDGLVCVAGTNAKLSEYHAAVALASLDGWTSRRDRRVGLHQLYLRLLASRCPAVQCQRRPSDGVYSTLPLLLPKSVSALDVAAILSSRGIETRRWYCPTLERHPAFASCPVAHPLPVSSVLNERLLGVPFHVHLSPEDIEAVCEALADAVTRACESV